MCPYVSSVIFDITVPVPLLVLACELVSAWLSVTAVPSPAAPVNVNPAVESTSPIETVAT